MKVATWNVNSLGARLERVLAFLDECSPDVLLVQETKVAPESFPHLPLLAAGYSAIDHSGGRWEGVAIIVRATSTIADVSLGLAGEPDSSQARWVEATVDGIRIASVYVPNGREIGTATFAEKLEFLDRMGERAVAMGDPAVIGGDMNVCPSDIDVWDPAQVHGATHVTEDERSRLNRVLEAGFVDGFRHLHPDLPGFSWWDYRAGHFHKGFGLRMDLVLVSTALVPLLSTATVGRDYRKPSKVPGTTPSDHAPVIITLG